jgi:preprotein translocase subunit SecD
MSQHYTRWVIPILILVTAAVWVALPDNPGIHLGFLDRDIQLVRGLDLQGGLRVLLEADLPPETAVTPEQMQTARDIVESRVNALGLTEPVVQVAGERRILVELPGVSDPDQAEATIRQTGLLEFVEIPAELVSFLQGTEPIQTDFGRPDAGSPADASPTAPAAGEETPATPPAEAPSPTPEAPVFHTVMTGAALQTAVANRDEFGGYAVGFQLTDEGTTTFADYTRAHIGGILAIVLDKQVISLPRIETAITEGAGRITGNFTYEEANRLAVQLRYGALPVPLRVAQRKAIGPTLGEDSLRRSAIAGGIGLAVVMLFMAIYYRLPGVLADLALMIYAVVTFALFKLIPVTLTLPGVAGFVLSLGVAVDANVLIFERMKEELRAGRTLRQAIDLGFGRAWPSIRDSNLSTLITCGILYWFGATFGASIVKGFSLTLSLGVVVSLFTAITVTRTFLHVLFDSIRLSEHPRWFGI